MDTGVSASSVDLQRSASHNSNASVRSHKSHISRIKSRKQASYASSSASSIAHSDKSLTSFPSFSPEQPKEQQYRSSPTPGDTPTGRNKSQSVASFVDSLTTPSLSRPGRDALFDDVPLKIQNLPGAVHLANDDHIERLLARHGAVALVRQIAEDLAVRDSQLSALRRKTGQRERALRKIILECGLSNLDLETRLRMIEDNSKSVADTLGEHAGNSSGLEELMSVAMSDTVQPGLMFNDSSEATIRASDALKSLEGLKNTAPKGWKDYIWGGSTSRKTSRANSVSRQGQQTTRLASTGNRRTALQIDSFTPPETSSIKSVSRASSVQSGNFDRERKPSSSLASLALKLVAGNTITARDSDAAFVNRGRSTSTGVSTRGTNSSTATGQTSLSTTSVAAKPNPKSIPTTRRVTVASGGANSTVRSTTQERWDTMGVSPQNNTQGSTDNYGPVEMDTILPPDAQPPTLTHLYNNNFNPEFLTDRFGFIYDQRRKKRQRETAEMVQKSKRGSRVEMLSGNRGGVSPTSEAGEFDMEDDVSIADRPETPLSNEERGDDGKGAKRWQDYLKIATFPTELLSHTPSSNVPAFEVMEGGELPPPRSPGITSEERGFLPAAISASASPTVPLVSDNATITTSTAPMPTSMIPKEDVEPVKLLLKQLGEVHDSLQRDKTVRWNEFLRKVRAERKREGDAAVAALAAAAETRTQRAMVVMPEVSLTDGEMIGVSNLGNKGKVGRAKWNEFKTLVLGGIPVAYRAKIWGECCGATAMRVPGYYEDLIAQREEEDDPAIVAQIQMDINRTLTDNIFFRKGPGVAKLNEVLLAYSRRNPEVGYCQGMNLITACLLLIMPTAEDAFWVLTSIIESTLPQGYFDHSLLASRADQQVLRQYVAEVLPRLSAHLDELSIELEALTFQWFLSIFTDCLSAEALFRVWDVVLCTNDGSTFLFQVALALLKLNEPQLLHCGTPAGVYTYINHQMTNHAISIDGLIHASEGLRKVVRREDIDARRAKAIEAERELVRQRAARNNLRRAQKKAVMDNASEPPESNIGSSGGGGDDDGISSQPKSPGSEDGGYDDLTVRTPIPMEEERQLGLG